MSVETSIEEVVSAHRDRDPRGAIVPAPAFHDLEPDDRERAYRETLLQRTLESALDAEGLSTTARAVLGRIRAVGSPRGG